ncbi:MAG: DUF3421 domain-containing protein [Cohaesibacter sp.]|jgi:hypothetical protein|nr:DUF3421 domain-containing protein [Cohaesibacter sp.]
MMHTWSKKLSLALAATFLAWGSSSVPSNALKIEDPAHIQWIYLAGRSIPDSLYSAAADKGKVVRVCRVRHRKDFEVGYLQGGFCQIGGDGMSRPYSEYEVLVFAKKTGWQEAKRRQLPANVEDISAGTRGGNALYLCRIHYEDSIAVGTIDGEGYCIAGYKTGELKSDEFDVLVRQ